LREVAETLSDKGEDRIFPEITDKKSLGSFIAKRAGIVWDKPFQNMRATGLQALIRSWNDLPKSGRKTIVTLAKASRKKKRSR